MRVTRVTLIDWLMEPAVVDGITRGNININVYECIQVLCELDACLSEINCARWRWYTRATALRLLLGGGGLGGMGGIAVLLVPVTKILNVN